MNLHHRSSHNCMQAVKHQPTPASMGIHNPIQLHPCTNINTNSRNITIFINHRLTNQFFIWVASCLVLTHTNQAHTIRRIIMIQISIGVPCRSHRWRCREGSVVYSSGKIVLVREYLKCMVVVVIQSQRSNKVTITRFYGCRKPAHAGTVTSNRRLWLRTRSHDNCCLGVLEYSVSKAPETKLSVRPKSSWWIKWKIVSCASR